MNTYELRADFRQAVVDTDFPTELKDRIIDALSELDRKTSMSTYYREVLRDVLS